MRSGRQNRQTVKCADCKLEIRRGAEEHKRVEFRLMPDKSIKIFGWQMPDGPLTAAFGPLVKVLHSKCYWAGVKAKRREDAAAETIRGT